MAKRINKSAKKATNKVEKVELTESLNKIKKTATTVTGKVLETVTDVMDDVTVNGKYWATETSEVVMETIANIDIEKTAKGGIKTAKKTVKSINEFVLETADELVEGSMKNGKKMQSITAKAIEGGLKITAKQQDIVFDTLETVKKQLGKNAVRFSKMFN
ncbi:MAG: hypothetical protein ACI8YQ_004564 [Polaribacter sp.]|jgi:hypothetical protein